jgi:hypothetical protein
MYLWYKTKRNFINKAVFNLYIIKNDIIGIFHWRNPSGRTMVLGSTQSLTEMSTRSISCGVKAAVRKADNLTTFMCRLSWSLGASNYLNPRGLSKTVMELILCQNNSILCQSTNILCQNTNILLLSAFRRIWLVVKIFPRDLAISIHRDVRLFVRPYASARLPRDYLPWSFLWGTSIKICREKILIICKSESIRHFKRQT